MLVRISITVLISLLSFITRAQETIAKDSLQKKGVTILVKIPKISSNNGKVYFSLYDTEEHFKLRTPFQSAIGTIQANTTQVSFTNVPEGTYAIICYHDENDNKQLDFNGFMPTEDYGASNNPVVYGPPQFGLSSFTVDKEDVSLIITF